MLEDFGGMDCANQDGDDSGGTATVYIEFGPEKRAMVKWYHPSERNGYGPLYRFAN